MNISIYTMTHKLFSPPADPIYIPLELGKAVREDLGYLGDDTGDNISSMNCYFAELTGAYWVWKNVHDADIVGICHYRRFLIDDKENILNHDQIESLLIDNDLITTMLLELRSSYYDGFASNHNINDLIQTGEVIKELYPDYYPLYDKIIHDNRTYFGNIIICRKDLYDSYCSWLFSILFELKRRVSLDDYDDYQKRLFGFLSEILLYVYCSHNMLRVVSCKVGMIGEKKETAEIKHNLALLFKAHDFISAKEYICGRLAKRPDVLMEASDVFGELKICMQIISTCEFEYGSGKTTVLDRCDDLKELIPLFKKTNKIAGRTLKGLSDETDKKFLSDNMISTEMFDIACTIAKAQDSQG